MCSHYARQGVSPTPKQPSNRRAAAVLFRRRRPDQRVRCEHVDMMLVAGIRRARYAFGERAPTLMDKVKTFDFVPPPIHAR
jgi:hypothetical protein